jgi:hypothetical protein
MACPCGIRFGNADAEGCRRKPTCWHGIRYSRRNGRASYEFRMKSSRHSTQRVPHNEGFSQWHVGGAECENCDGRMCAICGLPRSFGRKIGCGRASAPHDTAPHSTAPRVYGRQAIWYDAKRDSLRTAPAAGSATRRLDRSRRSVARATRRSGTSIANTEDRLPHEFF